MKSISSWSWSTWTYIFIILLFLVRLENIELPPLDVHEYRQALTLGVARNYIEWDSKMIPPRSMICDSRDGYVITEFPVYNYAISILWRIFGQENWVFRTFTLIISCIGTWHFFLIARRMMEEKAAFASSVILTASILYIYARKGMPDVFSISLVIIGLSHAWSYMVKGQSWRLIVFVICLALGLLSKIPSAIGLSLLMWPFFFEKLIPLKRKLQVLGGGMLAVGAMAAWYFVWIPWAVKAYGLSFYFNIPIDVAWKELFSVQWHYTKQRFFPIALQSYLAYAGLVAGMGFMFFRKKINLMVTLLAGIILLFLFMLQVGGIFSVHEYYIIPFVPLMALIAGYGAGSGIKNKWVLIAFATAVSIETIIYKRFDFFLDDYAKRFVQLEALAAKYIPPDDRILVAGDPFMLPSMLYQSHRKGWAEYNPERVYQTEWIKGEGTVGMRYVITDRLVIKDSLQFPMVYEGNEFRIFRVPVVDSISSQ